MGPIGLHGGGEFLAGDELFLNLLLDAAAAPAAARAAACGSPAEAREQGAIRVSVVPTAAARERPDLAGAHAVAAFQAVASARGIAVRAEVVPIVDARSAAEPGLAGTLAAADLIHLPGGHPGLVVEILADTLAWRSILSARARGAVLAGASAGAMALAEWTWTPEGGRLALGLVRGVLVAPHFEGLPRERWAAERDRVGRPDLGVVALDERTGVLSGAEAGAWRVAGQGRAAWLGPGAAEPLIARHGELLRIHATLAAG